LNLLSGYSESSYRFFAFCLLIFSLSVGTASADKGLGSLISPGELSSLHKSVEGITNCTKCHALRSGITNDNCIDCHKDIGARVSAKKGYHSTVSSKKCFSCHTDHKGKNFKLIDWNEKRFDHSKAGYALKGKHKSTACSKCHTTKTKAGRRSFLGAKTNCVDCHKKDDKHKGTLGKACEQCHTEKNWKDLKFNHNTTKYKLKGKHTKVKCESCHANKKKGDFKVAKFDTCSASGCHDNRKRGGLTHRKQFTGKKCESCHTVNGWKPSLFKHNNPNYKGYKLKGKHARLACKKCHTARPGSKVVRFKPISTKSCSGKGCHDTRARGNIHGRQFKGKQCNDCHTVNGWKSVRSIHDDPNYKGYKLKGRHSKVSCNKCHRKDPLTKRTVYKPIDSTTCNTAQCHGRGKSSKTHGRQFKGESCENCHKVEGWKPSTFRHNKKTYKGFKLTGLHARTACSKCHTKGYDGKTKYKPIASKSCDSSGCHDIRSRGNIHGSMFGGKSCENCHSTKGWKRPNLLLNHDTQTKYKLEGKHKTAKCEHCHINKKWKPLKTDCIDCHKKNDIHKGSFGKKCEECHDSQNWNPKGGFHETTGFPLEGQHKITDCSDCHKDKGIFGGLSADDCTTCHIDPHFNQLGTACEECHTAFDWNPTKFNHGTVASFRLEGAHRIAECKSCHLNREYRLAEINCEDCHGAGSTRGGSFVYNTTNKAHATGVTTCDSCHKTYASTPATYTHTSMTFQGAHISLSGAGSCSSCHPVGSPDWALKSTGGWVATTSTTATDCEDCHIAKFTSASSANAGIAHNKTGASGICNDCHSVTASVWTQADAGHTTMTFPGQHATALLTCTKCHTAGVAIPLKAGLTGATLISQCATCHSADFSSASSNAGVAHTGKTSVSDCATSGCHKSTDATFASANYTHSVWTFTGAHTSSASSCTSCHNTGDATTIRSPYNLSSGASSGLTNTDCDKCHQTQYTNATSSNSSTGHGTFAGDSQCTKCHFTSHTAWSQAVFGHTVMTFTGAHSSLKSGCTNCHVSAGQDIKALNGGSQRPTSDFTDLSSSSGAQCIYCHTSQWNKKLGDDHKTGQEGQCLACHNTSTFNR